MWWPVGALGHSGTPGDHVQPPTLVFSITMCARARLRVYVRSGSRANRLFSHLICNVGISTTNGQSLRFT